MSKEIEFKVLSDGVWIIDNVRLSFPNLWKPGRYQGAETTRLSGSVLIPKEQVDVFKKIAKAYLDIAKAANPEISKLNQIKYNKLAKTENGDFIVKFSNSVDYPPAYIDFKGKLEPNPLAVGADKILYAGCYVRIKLQLIATIDKGITKVWSNLAAIQFREDGERFGKVLSDDELTEGFNEVDSGDFERASAKPDDDLSSDNELDLGNYSDLNIEEDELDL